MVYSVLAPYQERPCHLATDSEVLPYLFHNTHGFPPPQTLGPCLGLSRWTFDLVY